MRAVRSCHSRHVPISFTIDLLFSFQCPKLSISPRQMSAPMKVHHPLYSQFSTTAIAPIGDKIGDRLWLPRSAPNEESQGESSFVDSSGPIFSMYMEMADDEDKKLAESWQADADGILIFVRLYSALVSHPFISRRPVYSLPSSHRLYRCRFRAFNRIHRTHPTFTLQIYIRRLLPTQIDLIFRLPFPPPHLHSLHPRMPSGSTHFGS